MFYYINRRNLWIQGLEVIIVDATEKLEKTFLPLATHTEKKKKNNEGQCPCKLSIAGGVAFPR